MLRGGKAEAGETLTQSELAREAELLRTITQANTRLTREQSRSGASDASLASSRSEVERARLAYEGFRFALYAARPELRARRGEYAGLTDARIAELMPDERTALIEFAITNETSLVLFVLTRDSRTKLFALTAHEIKIDRREITARIDEFHKRIARRDLLYKNLARELYDSLLAPISDALRGTTRLVIVPDGALWALPFQALIDERGRYLIETHAISYAPSLAVLSEMQRAASLKRLADNPVSLLAFGTASSGAEAEVERLANIYPAKRSRVFTGASAREESFKSEAERHAVLHVAAHGTVDDANPMYSHIRLAAEPETAEATEDGLLEAWEIARLRLRADLVVLSACETARGRAAAGEGVIGLSWALFVPGAPASIVSNWKVYSASTTELMVGFHRRLRRTSGAYATRPTKAEALRQASLFLLRERNLRHPFYWAGFVLIGDGA